MARRPTRIVWERTPQGWKRVRARVPSGSERVPRPPSSPGHARGARVQGGAGGALDPDTFKRGLREIGELGEAIARAMLIPIELARQIAKQLGGAPGAALVVYALYKSTQKKGTSHGRRSRSD
jgi:hypothetical protein